MTTEGILPGGLNVRRRAARLAPRPREKSSLNPEGTREYLTPMSAESWAAAAQIKILSFRADSR
jgi:L-serine deaminase